MLPNILNYIGLVSEIIGSTLMLIFNVALFEEDKNGDITPTEVSKINKNKKYNKLGIFFLLMGFSIQLVGMTTTTILK